MISTKPLDVRGSNFCKYQVIDRSIPQSVGQVSEVWVDLGVHRILGFSCRVGFRDTDPRIYRWEQVVTLDMQQVIVETETAQGSSVQDFDLTCLHSFEARVDYHVWTYSFDRISTVVDYCFNPNTGEITDYLCMAHCREGLVKDRFHLPPSSIVDAGRGWLLVPDGFLEQVELKTQ